GVRPAFDRVADATSSRGCSSERSHGGTAASRAKAASTSCAMVDVPFAIIDMGSLLTQYSNLPLAMNRRWQTPGTCCSMITLLCCDTAMAELKAISREDAQSTSTVTPSPLSPSTGFTTTGQPIAVAAWVALARSPVLGWRGPGRPAARKSCAVVTLCAAARTPTA